MNFYLKFPLATKKELIDTKTALEGMKVELTNTNAKLDNVITEMVNNKPDFNSKLDGKTVFAS